MKFILNIILGWIFLNNVALAGGIDGGGGTTTLVHPIAERDVMWTAEREAKLILRGYSRFLESTGNPISYPNGSNLFSGATTLIDAVEHTPIEYKKDGPCVDGQGNAVDGSIKIGEENKICLSSETIKSKVSYETKDGQISALILHELGHLFGLNEVEADELQEKLLWFFDSMNMIGYEGLGRLPETFIQALNEDTSQFDSGELYLALRNINQMSKTINISSGKSNLLDLRQTSYFKYQLTKLQLLLLFAKSQTNFSGAEDALKQYRSYFNGNKQVEFYKVVPEEYGKPYSNYPFQRAKNDSDIRKQLAEVAKYFDSYYWFWYSFSMGQPLKDLEDPLRPKFLNPWKKFVGKYKTQNITCVGSLGSPEAEDRLENMVDIEIDNSVSRPEEVSIIHKDKAGKLYKEELFPGGRSALLTMPLTRVLEINGSTFAHKESGSGWNFSSQDIFKIKGIRNNRVEFVRTIKYYGIDNDGATERVLSCKYELEKLN